MRILIDKEMWDTMIWRAHNTAVDLAESEGISSEDIYYALHFGPAHIVWEDLNLDLCSIKWCLNNFDKYVSNHSEECLKYVKYSLLELIMLYEMFDVQK